MDDHRWIPWLRGERRSSAARKDERVEPVVFERGVDAIATGKRDVLLAVCLVSATVRLQLHLVRDVELRLPVLQSARGLVRAIPGAELRERPDRRPSPSEASHALKSRFMPLEHDGTILVASFRVARSAASRPQEQVACGITS